MSGLKRTEESIRLDELERRVESLERTAPVGSGPATGSAGRGAVGEPGEGPERKEGGTTDCSRESRAVPPGEAEAAVAVAVSRFLFDAACAKEDQRWWSKLGDNEGVRIAKKEAAKFERWAESLIALLPEPDSDAGLDLTALYDQPTPPVPHGREETCDERSGRRNDQGETRPQRSDEPQDSEPV